MMKTTEEKLIQALREHAMKPREMLLCIGLTFTLENLAKLASLLDDIKKVYPLKEKIPGCFYIWP